MSPNLFGMDVQGVSEDIVEVNRRFWVWAVFLCSLLFLGWQIGINTLFNDPKLLEDRTSQREKEIILRPLPRAKRSIEPIAPWTPSNDLLDALLDESFTIRDILVRLPDDESMRKFIVTARDRGLRVEDDLARFRLLRVRLASGRQARDLFDLLPDDSEPEPNYPVYVPDLPETENVRGIAPFGSQAVEWLDTPGDRSNWGKGVLVAILDTGVDFTHPALEGVKGTNLNLMEDESEEASYDGHGTAVASIIAGNSEVIGGLAPMAEILSLQVLNSEGIGDGYTVAKGIIEAVDRGAEIINLSLGSAGPSLALQDAIEYAQEKKVLVVASVGNDGQKGVTFPARYEGVIGVTAIDAKGTQATFSNYGEGVDIGAPGTGVHAAWSEGSIVSFSGTSAATPFVTGALAGMISENRAMLRQNLPDLLYAHANDDVMPGEDPYVGQGVLDVGRIAGRNQKGTYDVAITGYYFDLENFEGEGSTPFLVSIQNQGTEWIDRATLEVNYGEISKTVSFANLGVGEVKSQELQLAAKNAEDPDGTRIVSKVSLDSQEDADKDNNFRSTRITLPGKDE